ncbi:hypothetical protein ACJMK2_043116 [Sinanodonta woodiana]|uniref:HAUS augmin-like complex subunit 1 n=1 Tax=Sinanodonta woodiana TaxID=1069815 RepID=A0ABD3VVX7_SINWO
MNQKHQEVQAWLERTFAGATVPAYELNQRTVGLLHELMLKNERSDRNMQLVIEDLRQKSDEYNAESCRLENILKSMNLTPASLSQSGIMSLRALANLALLLKTKDASDTNYLLALQHLQTEMSKVEDARKQELRTTENLQQKTKSALIKYNSLKRALELLEEQAAGQHPEMENHVTQTKFFHDKSRDYRGQIQQLQNHLDKIRADPSLYHQTIVKQAEELHALKEEIAPLKAKLDAYHSLPPDISLAKVKLEEIRQQVAALDAEITKRIDLMHM